MARRRRPNHGVRLRVGDLATDAMAKLVPRDRLRLTRVQIAWPKIARGRLAAMAWPVGARDNVLTVAVLDNQWLHELSYMRGDLLARLRDFCPEAEIREIKLRVGPVEPLPAEVAPPVAPPLPSLPDEPSPETLAALEAVRDPELRQAIANARLALSHRLRR